MRVAALLAADHAAQAVPWQKPELHGQSSHNGGGNRQAEAQTQPLTVDELEQIRAGAQVVQIFDTWGGTLSTPAYREFSLAYMQRIVDGLIREHDGRRVPVILFTKNGGQYLEKMAATGADALGLDWTSSLGDARRRVGDQVALQGNLDPSILFSRPERIQAAVSDVLEDFGPGSGHVFNLGHGISQHTDPEHAAAMIAAVQAQSPAYHREP